MKKLFVLFPTDLYEDYTYLRMHKVVMVEHMRFFDRSSKLHGHMKLNILKPIYHRLSMQYYFKYLKSKKIDVAYISIKDNWINEVKSYLDNSFELTFFDPVDRILESEINESFDVYNVINSPRFLLEYEDMIEYRDTNGSLRQTTFYKWMRNKMNILMVKSGDNSKPEGGKLTYDTENRKPPYRGMSDDMNKKKSMIGSVGELDLSQEKKEKKEIKNAVKYIVDNIPESHINIWNGRYSTLKKNSYDLKSVGLELRFPYDHAQTKKRLTFFITNKLKNFGEYQDSIIAPREDSELRSLIYHSGLSVMMNIGLITPLEVIDAIINHYNTLTSAKKKCILNSVEGFIRQILGWREFCRYAYEFESVKYLNKNHFNAKSKLSKSWYSGTTDIAPVDDAIEKGFKFGYLHHIERLMVIANYMTLISIDPKEMFKWFTEFALDSYDWVMEYNVYVMGSYSDGGHFTSKPYISSSNYIIKMSDYSKNMDRDWIDTWNLKFWQFIKKHSSKIKKINRLNMLIKYADNNIKKIMSAK